VPGERLACSLEQIDRRRTEDEEMSLPASAAPAFVDQHAQALEELGRALDLIEDHQLAGGL
jgi:hypothetical protein